jgi:hypothetical protein
MLRTGLAFLGIAALGFLLIASKVAVVGPCTDTLGAFALFAVILGAPLGLVLLPWSIIRSRRRNTLPSEGSPPTDPA